MGLLIKGQWSTDWYDTASNQGQFKRSESAFRHWVTHDGSAGPSGKSGFKAEAGRYHLYVSLACPWAHRTLIYRSVKGLEKIISVSVVNAHMGEQGWRFNMTDDGQGIDDLWLNSFHQFDEHAASIDSVNGKQYLHQVYTQSMPDFTGRVTVPVLWDKKTRQIVSNESAEIIRMFNCAFDEVGALEGDFCPDEMVKQIDEMNDIIYPSINNGVYRAGFATTQAAYQEAVTELFAALDRLEQRLVTQDYLLGNDVTEADWRLLTTLIRFDAVYVGHFKCNIRRIADYPHLHDYLKRLYRFAKVSDTVNMAHIKAHYYGSHKMINPTGIIPVGPQLAFLT
ncbi:glutathione S-transferase family protein [uncultured Shewanella sp.]|uniref:glutathione S-transferase family protein n=1 Tax=uncultured Shewanella sp. TaxID=173975 RepID=UPI0026331D70|nr:glutathione S-transferase family protein [uncultured Shewanella sp.]